MGTRFDGGFSLALVAWQSKSVRWRGGWVKTSKA